MTAHAPLWLALPLCLYAWPVLAQARVSWLLFGVPAAALVVCLVTACVGNVLLPQFELAHLQTLFGVLCACAAATALAPRLHSDPQIGWLLVVGCCSALLLPGSGGAMGTTPAVLSADIVFAALRDAAMLALLLLLCRAAARRHAQISMSVRLYYGAVLALLLIGGARWIEPAPAVHAVRDGIGEVHAHA